MIASTFLALTAMITAISANGAPDTIVIPKASYDRTITLQSRTHDKDATAELELVRVTPDRRTGPAQLCDLARKRWRSSTTHRGKRGRW